MKAWTCWVISSKPYWVKQIIPRQKCWTLSKRVKNNVMGWNLVTRISPSTQASEVNRAAPWKIIECNHHLHPCSVCTGSLWCLEQGKLEFVWEIGCMPMDAPVIHWRPAVCFRDSVWPSNKELHRMLSWILLFNMVLQAVLLSCAQALR